MRAVATVAAVALLVTPTTARAASEHEHCRRVGAVVRCEARDRPQTGGGAGGGGTTPTTISPNDIVWWPTVVLQEPVGLCIDFVREIVPGGAIGLRGREAEERALELIALYDVCPGIQRPPASPSAIARQVVEEFLPAPPTPEIDPGYAIAGKTAYLETKGNLHPPTQTRATPLGDIDVTFTGQYRVDWGDGTTETFTTEGEPWPTGRITHTYTHVGYYNVVVTIEWTARWRIATTTGEITNGLASVARIDNFEVRQLQAVRDR